MSLAKTTENYKRCQLCGFIGKSKQSIIIHIQQSHKTTSFKQYYDMFFKELGEGICSMCSNSTKWNGKNYTKNGNRYYTKHCSVKCGTNDSLHQKHKESTCLSRYGVSNIQKLDSIREKIGKSNRITYHNINTTNKRNATILQKYGNIDNYNTIRIARAKETNLSLYGVEYPLLNKDIFKRTRTHGVSSKLHLKIKDILNLERMGFKSELSIDKYVVDEINIDKKLIIEINGDYIHANPKKYIESDIITIGTNVYSAKTRWDYDDSRKLQLAAYGYIIFTIWESDNLHEKQKELDILLGLD